MELKNRLRGKKVYFDVNVIIYLVEGFADYQSFMDDIQQLLEEDGLRAITSELSLGECLVKSFKVKSTEGASLFCGFLEESGCFDLRPISKDVVLRAAYIAAHKGMKLADSIHVATAIASGCEVFLTNDKKIKTPKSLSKVVLAEL